MQSTRCVGSYMSVADLKDLMRSSAARWNAEALERSWTFQTRAEQSRRLDAVIKLSVELAKVRETTNFATRLAELAIESVIEGDWQQVEEWADHFTFDDEREEIRVSAGPAYAMFRELLMQVLRAGKGKPA